MDDSTPVRKRPKPAPFLPFLATLGAPFIETNSLLRDPHVPHTDLIIGRPFLVIA